MGKKYQCQLSSRLQRVAPDNSDYYFKPPNCEQNRKYSNLQERTYRTAVVEPTAALGDRFAPCPATVLWRSGEREVAKNPESPRSRRARQMAAAAQQATLQKKPLLAQIRQPVAALERPRAGVAYNIRRLEEWFRLMDTNNSGEITLGQDGHSTMTWPEFVEFFRQSGLLLEYETRDELNSSSLGETSIAAHLKKQEDEEQRFQALFFSRERRGALAPRSSRSSVGRAGHCMTKLAEPEHWPVVQPCANMMLGRMSTGFDG
eukprot:g15951.t1